MTTTTKFFEVQIAASAIGPAARIAVPFGTSKLDAIDKALPVYRQRHDIPPQHTLTATAQTVPLLIGTTVPSKSRTAIVPKSLR
jgi:hypothetical protein